MKARGLFLVVVGAASCLLFVARAEAAKQRVALFAPRAAGFEGGSRVAGLVARALADRLADRFDVRLVDGESGADAGDRKRAARSVGAQYVLTGNLFRIGRVSTLDLTVAPTEDPEKGRTVVVTSRTRGMPTEPEKGEAEASLAPGYRNLALQASAKLELAFFGNGRTGPGSDARPVPSPAGRVTPSRNMAGDVVAVASGDTDRDGAPEIVAAYPDSIVIYRVEGQDLVEKARISEEGGGLIHVAVMDWNRNGKEDVVAVRFVSGRAASDIWEYDGHAYRRVARDIPYFLQKADMGAEGVVLLGQESDPATIFRGPVFRIQSEGTAQAAVRGAPLPLPAGTWIYSFVPVRFHGGVRFVNMDEEGRLVLRDGKGAELWKSIDAFSGPDLALKAPMRKLAAAGGQRTGDGVFLPGGLFAVDIDGDGNDEVVVLNNIVSGGGFFESLRIRANAEVLCFAQNALRLHLAWRTPLIDAPADDAIVEVPPGTKRVRVGIASRDRSKFPGEYGEWRLYWVK